MKLLPKNKHGCPYLQLAPMEGVGDRSFRLAIAKIGGFDEAVRDFLRVPLNAHIPSLAAAYEKEEIAPFPLAAQIMGADPSLMAGMAKALEAKGAPRIDVNCGCPSNTVTGKGAGSSLLKDPSFLHEVVSAVVQAVKIPVTVKMRSGFEDTSLFQENLLAAESSGVSYITLHPRTKVDGYGPPAKWELIKEAKSILKIPLVGNGDILNVQDALGMLEKTNCDALMIGRGSLINPFLFCQIKAHFENTLYVPQRENLENYLRTYLASLLDDATHKARIGKLKQLLGFIFKANSALLEKKAQILTSSYENPEDFLQFALDLIEQNWKN